MYFIYTVSYTNMVCGESFDHWTDKEKLRTIFFIIMCKMNKIVSVHCFKSFLFYRNRKPKLTCIVALEIYNKMSFILVIIIAEMLV